MAGGLFQISEPGESQIKEACDGRVIGIDLGTTNSLVATVRAGQPACLPDAEGRTLLPSAVQYRAGEAPLVGREALDAGAGTIVSSKRFIGRKASEVVAAQKFATFALVDDGSDSPVVRFAAAGRPPVTPIEVAAEILRTLRERAEAELGGELDGAVITVPAYFDDAQRQATKDAGRLAGLNVLRLVNEPTAAALAYGLDKQQDGLFAIYDLGGGTFDISILKLQGGVFEVKSTAGDTALGGDDFDRALAELLIARRPALASDTTTLLARARQLKHALTTTDTAVLAGTDLAVTRAEFDAAIAPIVERTGAACRRAIKDAGIKVDALDGVVLVGGATRVPAVRAFVAKLFGKEPLSDLNPDEVVALGAAVQADILGGSGRDDLLLLDVLPLSLGLETMGGLVEKLIHRNSTIPAGAKQTFTTYADGQTGFDLHVVQGEREAVADCRSLGRFKLRGIPPMAAGMARLEVTFLVDADGILKVSAREETSGVEASIACKPSYGLSEEQIEQMLLDSYEYAETDLKNRMLTEARVEAERILSAMRVAMAADGDLLSDDERAAIETQAAALAAAAAGTSHRAIRDATEQLDRVTKPFAERRMNRSMTEAMGGRALDEVDQQLSNPHAKD